MAAAGGEIQVVMMRSRPLEMFPSPILKRVSFSAFVTLALTIILFISGATAGLGMWV